MPDISSQYVANIQSIADGTTFALTITIDELACTATITINGITANNRSLHLFTIYKDDIAVSELVSVNGYIDLLFHYETGGILVKKQATVTGPDLQIVVFQYNYEFSMAQSDRERLITWIRALQIPSDPPPPSPT